VAFMVVFSLERPCFYKGPSSEKTTIKSWEKLWKIR